MHSLIWAIETVRVEWFLFIVVLRRGYVIRASFAFRLSLAASVSKPRRSRERSRSLLPHCRPNRAEFCYFVPPH